MTTATLGNRLWKWSAIAGLLGIIFTTSGLVYFSRPPSLPDVLHCGSTPDEARSLGCVYSLVDVRWVPAPCYDAEMDNEFISHGWTRWYDRNATREMTLDIAKQGETEYWVTMEYHIVHCQYTFRQLRRRYWDAARQVRYISSSNYLTEDEHFFHCLEYMDPRIPQDPDLVITLSEVGFGTCQVPQLKADRLM
ncbi:hypothetical protein COCVIDRAFT_117222 [Bipolaris victoriae FI3]|uniref:Uncharacterized protein n=1 Tax=Bipolaris victoriae (strain FI3) TaxID=930091 RepID=W7DZK5_BIPV3|nr:hypothetical protein COCVIDRAFT_117222 [Bipolaris victoriae FI3]